MTCVSIKLYASKVGGMYWIRNWDPHWKSKGYVEPVIVLSRPFASDMLLWVNVLTPRGVVRVDERVIVYESHL